MEFTEYLAVLRRHWRIWVGCTLVTLATASVVLQITPSTYEATARVFVSASPSISNSAQFVIQRSKSYPAVAESQAVLGPVIERLGLAETTAELRSRVSAENPADTSQVEVTTSGRNPDEVAAISNAVAQRLAEVIEELETPTSGDRPVTLTVNDPATAPTKAAAPVALYVLGLGLIAGLFVGLAAAVVRSRLDTRLATEDDVRRAWGGDEDVEVLAPARGRARRSALTGRPTAVLARRLEAAAEERSIRVAILSASPGDLPAARGLAGELAEELRGRDVPAATSGPGLPAAPLPEERPHVRLEVTDPLASRRFRRDAASRYDAVVLVLPQGRVAEADLREVRKVLRAAAITPLAIVLTGRTRARAGQADDSGRDVLSSLPAEPTLLRTPREPVPTPRG